jgi:hypothetical protein
MNAPSREAQRLLDLRDAVNRRIALFEGELRALRRERCRLQKQLQDTGYRDASGQLDLFGDWEDSL